MTWGWYTKLIFKACLTACLRLTGPAQVHYWATYTHKCVEECTAAASAEQAIADQRGIEEQVRRLHK